MTMLVRTPSVFDFDAMDRRFRRMLEGFGLAPALVPAADVYETGEEWVIELEAPGYGESDLSLEVRNHSLTIKGTREQVSEEEEKTFRMHERLEREFERTFALPTEVDTDHVTAKFVKGVLEVHAPKLPVFETRKIEITT
jgi:HSP20 family protein